MSFFRKLRMAILFDRAFQRAAYHRYEEAMRCLEAAEKLDLRGRKWTSTDAYGQLLKALLKVRLQRYDEALDILINTHDYLTALPTQTAETLYLRCFAATLAGEPIKKLKYTDISMRALQTFKTPYDTVDLKAVPNHVKRKFPLPSHPAWESSA